MYTLNLKDTKLLSFDMDTGYYEVHVPELLPYSMRKTPNYRKFLGWINQRHLPLDRANVKLLLNAMRLPQGDTFEVMLATKALSLNDCYWIASEGDKWSEVNLYDNPFSEVLAGITLLADIKAITIQGQILTPETVGQGTYAKAWKREDGDLWLYKANYNKRESEAEYICHIIAEILGIGSVPYELVEVRGVTCSRCPNISNKEVSIVPIYDFYGGEYRDVFDWLGIVPDRDKFLEMLVFDGLVGNHDRHLRNWGVYVNAETTEVIGLHPLFDHNCAIDIETNFVKTPSPIVSNMTNTELARWAYKRVDHLWGPVAKLKDWYETREARVLFKRVYGRLDELEYLKERVREIT